MSMKAVLLFDPCWPILGLTWVPSPRGRGPCRRRRSRDRRLGGGRLSEERVTGVVIISLFPYPPRREGFHRRGSSGSSSLFLAFPALPFRAGPHRGLV